VLPMTKNSAETSVLETLNTDGLKEYILSIGFSKIEFLDDKVKKEKNADAAREMLLVFRALFLLSKPGGPNTNRVIRSYRTRLSSIARVAEIPDSDMGLDVVDSDGEIQQLASALCSEARRRLSTDFEKVNRENPAWAQMEIGGLEAARKSLEEQITNIRIVERAKVAGLLDNDSDTE
jgi:hypothetical protein